MSGFIPRPMPRSGVIPATFPGASFPPRSAIGKRAGRGVAPLGLALLLGPLVPPAGASSPDAWRTYDLEVRAACRKASRLEQPRMPGERIDVPAADRTPDGGTLLISAVLLQGRKGRELCLYEQRTRRATVAEAEFLDRPRSRP